MDVLRRMWNYWNQVDGQVLLFLRPPKPKTREQILSVFLLPKNVPVEEVKAQMGNSVYIETAAECKLIKGERYTVDCLEGCKIQPQRAEFSLGRGPNYHPTFEIFLPYMLEEIYITIRDQKDADVWTRRVVLTAPGPAKTPKWTPPVQDVEMMGLINILDNLGDGSFKEFKWFLSREMLGSIPLITENQLLTAGRKETIYLMVQEYGLDRTSTVMKRVLRKMNMNINLNMLEELTTATSGKKGDSEAKLDPITTETKMDVSKDDTKPMKPPSRFTPELKTESTKVSYRFRCPGPGGFQCTLTGLVFVVDQEAELLYRTIQWDESLLQSAGKTPAGPLFDIQCPEDAVCELHLPHCETKDGLRPEGLLSVVHITDDGMTIIEPLKITDTHVIVKVPHLSAFGLGWALEILVRLWNSIKPIAGEVLLFLRPQDRGLRVLDVFLLPCNIPLPEVAAQQGDAKYIKISSDCKLSIGQSYCLHCEPQGFHIQPECAEFRSKYGPNFFATFEVFLTTNPKKVTLTVQDQERTEVWKRCVPLPEDRLPAEAGLPAEDRLPADERLLQVRIQFINRVSEAVLDQLLDKLLRHHVVTFAEMESLKTKNRAKTARNVIDAVQKKGPEASSVLIAALCEVDQCLSRVLALR